jgi:hypothetical protein
MIDVLIHVAKFTKYYTISRLTQVSRELRDARLWRQAMREQYPHSLMNDNCEYLPDYLRYLIAKGSDYLVYDGNFALYEYTDQVEKINKRTEDFIQLFPKHLGQYFVVKNKCVIEISGDLHTVFNHIKSLGNFIHWNTYHVYNIKYFDYSFKCVNIDIDVPDDSDEKACYRAEYFVEVFRKKLTLCDYT